MRLVAVVFKGSRHKNDPKYAGGVLNPDKAFYVYRTQGNKNPQGTILQMRDNLMEQHNAQAQAQ